MVSDFKALIDQFKSDKESVFNTWFINNDERLKAFRSIRRGVMQMVDVMQLSRPAIKQSSSNIKYILFSQLRQHCDVLCRFGETHMIMDKIAKSVKPELNHII